LRVESFGLRVSKQFKKAMIIDNSIASYTDAPVILRTHYFSAAWWLGIVSEGFKIWDNAWVVVAEYRIRVAENYV
jgi:hypothetical protein